jgi:hypothetical protein
MRTPKEFIPYNLALELKQLGFDEPCLAFYERSKELIIQECEVTDFHTSSLQCLAPLYQQAFRWFREKHGLVGIVKFGTNDFTYTIYNADGIGLLTKESLNFNGTYEEAELVCLQKLIEIVKTK